MASSESMVSNERRGQVPSPHWLELWRFTDVVCYVRDPQMARNIGCQKPFEVDMNIWRVTGKE